MHNFPQKIRNYILLFHLMTTLGNVQYSTDHSGSHFSMVHRWGVKFKKVAEIALLTPLTVRTCVYSTGCH